MLGEVTGIDHDSQNRRRAHERHSAPRSLRLPDRRGGQRDQLFRQRRRSNDESFELKTLDDAVSCCAITSCACSSAPPGRTTRTSASALTTLVVVGGGPTGLETAGALAELYEHVLRKEYDQPLAAHRAGRGGGSPADAVSAAAYSESAYQQLQSLGVEVILGNGVDEVDARRGSPERWHDHPDLYADLAAGVKASPLAAMLDLPLAEAAGVSPSRRRWKSKALTASTSSAIWRISKMRTGSPIR